MKTLSFDNVFIDDTKHGKKMPSSCYLNEGKYKIIDQGQSLIAGYSNEQIGVYKDVPVVIFGDHTRIVKFIDFPFFLGADGTKILKNKLGDTKYLYYYLLNAKIPNTGYNRHFKWLKELQIPLPPLDEQKKIAYELDKITSLISLRKKQIEKLDLLVKAKFIEMFGDPVINSKNQKETDFINVIKLQRGFDLPVQNRANNGNIPVYGSNGILDFHNESKVNDSGIITGRSGTIGFVYYSSVPFWPLNTTLFGVNTYNNNKIYLSYLLKFFNLARFADGTSVPTLNRNNVHNKKIIDIPLSLQNQFAEYVEKTEKIKSDMQKGLEKLEVLYKSRMQEYFG